jgi:uncharacterized protein YjiS (DUF1127 family)
MEPLNRTDISRHASAAPVMTSSHAVLIAEARRRQAEFIGNLMRRAARAVGKASGLSALGETLGRHLAYRRTVAELHNLDDQVLRDLGLNRGEIERVALEACGLPTERKVGFLRRNGAAFGRWLDYQATRRRLQELDERTLADIGIERGMIDSVAWQSIYRPEDAAPAAEAETSAQQVTPLTPRGPKPATDPAPAFVEHAKAA